MVKEGLVTPRPIVPALSRLTLNQTHTHTHTDTHQSYYSFVFFAGSHFCFVSNVRFIIVFHFWRG